MLAPAGFWRASVAALARDGGGRAVRVALRLVAGGAPGLAFAFAPGQWVDVVAGAVPGAVGGYTVASTPGELARSRTIELLVRRSKHPVAAWLNDGARVGDGVALRVGGDMVLTEEHARSGVLAVAGGIGVTPVASMLSHAAETAAETAPPALTLLYSCRAAADFALVDRLDTAAAAAEAAGGSLRLVAHVTGGGGGGGSSGGDGGGGGGSSGGGVVTPPLLSPRWEVCRGRVTPHALGEALAELVARRQSDGHVRAAGPTAVACGPPAATDAWASALQELQPAPAAVLTERWW